MGSHARRDALRPVFSLVLAAALSNCSGTKPAVQHPSDSAPKLQPKITQFYATPPHPAKGEKTLVCYGTESANTVTLDPPDEHVWPSPSRCFELRPTKAVTYTLTAERDGAKATQSLTISMGAPQPELLSIKVDALEVPKGTPLTICYAAKNAADVTVTPGDWFGPHTPDKGCVQHVMDQTTTFKVRVRDNRGTIADGEDVEVKVLQPR